MRLKCSEKKHAFPLFTTATVVFLPYNQAIRTRLSDVTVFVLWKPHVNPLVFLISLWKFLYQLTAFLILQAGAIRGSEVNSDFESTIGVVLFIKFAYGLVDALSDYTVCL